MHLGRENILRQNDHFPTKVKIQIMKYVIQAKNSIPDMNCGKAKDLNEGNEEKVNT